MIKQIVIVIISLTLLYNQSFSQQEGYKDIKIGMKLFDGALFKSYKYAYYPSDSSSFRLTSINPQFICNEQIDFLIIKINHDSTINSIDLNTVDKIYKDVDDFFKNLETLTNCMVNSLGKADYFESGNDNPNGRSNFCWSFPNNNILCLYSWSPSVWDKNIKKHYQFTWLNFDLKPKKMW